MSDSLELCLPDALRGPATTIAPIAAGLSGAGVYRVDASGAAFVLKIGDADDWRRKLDMQRAAADAGLAPQIVHVDEARRAIVTAFVVDRSFPAYLGDPRTRDAALDDLGRTLRRVHELPLPPAAAPVDPRALIAEMTDELADFALPAFARAAAQRIVDEPPPPADRAPTVCHNDVNPTNLAYDGARILLLDWDTAGVNDPLYDLAAVAVFFRMDDATCRRLLAAHDGAPPRELPARFAYQRRVVATFCGTAFLHIARRWGHPGDAGGTLAETRSLAECYPLLRTGAIDLRTAAGQWAFGTALLADATNQ